MDPFQPIREHLLAMPGVTERLSHGSPAFFAPGPRGKGLCNFLDDHHGDGRVALWLAAPAGEQEALVAEDPEVYFRPPYVGARGWLGVRLDRGLALDVIQEHLDTARETVG
ncbi:MAG: hypothetical protein JWO22_747 [Frankiales bacterium]|nr:hypothetical protein [Frankiales bacterium]